MAAHRGPNMRCAACRHPQVVRINFLLARGANRAAVAREFKIDKDCVLRHWHRHISETFKRQVGLGPYQSEEQLRQLCAESGTSVLESLRAVYSGLSARWLANYEVGHDATLALLTRELHSNLGMQARLTRELMPTPTTVVQNFFSLPIFGELQSTLMRVLASHPEARAEVIRAFRDLEQRSPRMIEVAAEQAA